MLTTKLSVFTPALRSLLPTSAVLSRRVSGFSCLSFRVSSSQQESDFTLRTIHTESSDDSDPPKRSWAFPATLLLAFAAAGYYFSSLFSSLLFSFPGILDCFLVQQAGTGHHDFMRDVSFLRLSLSSALTQYLTRD